MTYVRKSSLVLGIILLLVGIFAAPLWMMLLPVPLGWIPIIVLIVIGAFLIKKYNKEKRKALNSNITSPSDDTQFWVCPNCGADTQLKDERQYCPSCKIYLSI